MYTKISQTTRIIIILKSLNGSYENNRYNIFIMSEKFLDKLKAKETALKFECFADNLASSSFPDLGTHHV